LDGILLLDKPTGVTSNHILQKIKRLLGAKKAGHTGTLDPLASGMLPLCFGEATKFSQYVLDSDKTYFVTMQLGVRTNTSDAEGEVVATREVKDFTLEDIDQAFDAFRGDILQTPTMFSAIKYQGRPLYEYARKGITIERAARPIHIFNITVLAIRKPYVDLTVHCGSGTYVRTLVDDVGEVLGCGAHVTVLRRLSVGKYREEQMISVDELESAENLTSLLLPLDTAVSHFPVLMLNAEDRQKLCQGKVIATTSQLRGMVRFYDEQHGFFGIGEINGESVVRSKRLISTIAC